ncbi:hypothetical protein BX600DRAFT_516178 [Xylariales sp. PMI_506]|nr:hypothetical protein BX600DRAFT_516178 [Xylariales sp. PMI_506]
MSIDFYLIPPPLGQVQYGMSNAPSRSHELIAMAVATTSIATAIVGLRFFTRIRLGNGWLHVDDYFVLMALLCSVATLVASTLQISHGLAYHMWDILFSQYNIWFPVYNTIASCTYALSIMFSKLSILLFYRRLSPQRWFSWSTYALIIASVTYSVIYVFVTMLPCTPVSALYDLTIVSSKCLNSWSAYLSLSILNIVMDFIILALPIPVVLPLKMEKRQKLSLILLFGTGILVCAITIRRTVLIPMLKASTDSTWDSVDDYMLSFPEMNAGIICASVPALKPLFKRLIATRTKSNRRNIYQKKWHYKSTTSKGTWESSTIVEQNRARRKLNSDSYPLDSLDDTAFRNTQTFTNEEEDINIWDGTNAEDCFGKSIGVARTLNVKCTPSSEELRYDLSWNDTHIEGLATLQPIQPKGITVTRETHVHYEDEW